MTNAIEEECATRTKFQSSVLHSTYRFELVCVDRRSNLRVGPSQLVRDHLSFFEHVARDRLQVCGPLAKVTAGPTGRPTATVRPQTVARHADRLQPCDPQTMARLADRPRPCDQDRGQTGRPTATARPRPWPDWPTDRDRATETVARRADRLRPSRRAFARSSMGG